MKKKYLISTASLLVTIIILFFTIKSYKIEKRNHDLLMESYLHSCVLTQKSEKSIKKEIKHRISKILEFSNLSKHPYKADILLRSEGIGLSRANEEHAKNPVYEMKLNDTPVVIKPNGNYRMHFDPVFLEPRSKKSVIKIYINNIEEYKFEYTYNRAKDIYKHTRK